MKTTPHSPPSRRPGFISGLLERLMQFLDAMGFWRNYSSRRLAKVIEAHQLWFSSRQKQGSRAILSDANLSLANLTTADLKYANLFRAYLRGADLQRADLRGADLAGTNLREANLKDALLNHDQLASAILDETTILPDGSNPKTA